MSSKSPPPSPIWPEHPDRLLEARLRHTERTIDHMLANPPDPPSRLSLPLPLIREAVPVMRLLLQCLFASLGAMGLLAPEWMDRLLAVVSGR